MDQEVIFFLGLCVILLIVCAQWRRTENRLMAEVRGSLDRITGPDLATAERTKAECLQRWVWYAVDRYRMSGRLNIVPARAVAIVLTQHVGSNPARQALFREDEFRGAYESLRKLLPRMVPSLYATPKPTS